MGFTVISFILGTTAELIKIAPVYHGIRERGMRPKIWFTAQHVDEVADVLADLNMPEPDGFDLLRMEHAKFPYLRIIVISGYLEGALLEAAKIFGAVATLQKPVSPADLVAKVREVLAR